MVCCCFLSSSFLLSLCRLFCLCVVPFLLFVFCQLLLYGIVREFCPRLSLFLSGSFVLVCLCFCQGVLSSFVSVSVREFCPVLLPVYCQRDLPASVCVLSASSARRQSCNSPLPPPPPTALILSSLPLLLSFWCLCFS